MNEDEALAFDYFLFIVVCAGPRAVVGVEFELGDGFGEVESDNTVRCGSNAETGEKGKDCCVNFSHVLEYDLFG